jgi:O-antigen/teichoic acid export membrane protein
LKNKQELEVITIGKGSLIGLMGSISFMLISLVTQWVLVRILGPEDFGGYSILVSTMNILVVIILLGLDQGLLRHVASEGISQGTSFKQNPVMTGLSIVVLFSIIVVPLSILISDWVAIKVYNKPELVNGLRLFFLSAPFFSLYLLLMEILRAKKKLIPRALISQITLPLLKLISIYCITLLVLNKILAIGYAMLFSGVVIFLVALWRTNIVIPINRNKRWKDTTLVIKDLLIFSIPLMFTSLVTRANAESEILLLGILTNTAQVGMYYIALKLTSIITMILTSINVIVAPLLAEENSKNDIDGLRRVFQLATRFAVTLALPITILLFSNSEEILILFNPEFVKGVTILRILSVAQLFFIATGPCGWLLVMSGYSRLSLVNSILTLILAIMLDIILVPRYGGVGAAIGGSAAIIIVNILRLVEVWYLKSIQPYNIQVLKPALAGIITIFGSLLFNTLLPGDNIGRNLLTSGIFVFGLYYFLLVVQGLNRSEAIIVQSLLNKIRGF